MSQQDGGFSSEELEMVTAFQQGQKELSELPSDLQNKMLYGVATGSEPEEGNLDTGGEVPEPTADEPTDGVKPKGKDKKQKRTKEETSQLLLERANKINELVQGQQRHEHKMVTDAQYRAEYLKKFGIEVGTQPTANKAKPDVWSEDYHLTAQQKLEAMEAKFRKIEEEKQAVQLYTSLEKFAVKNTGYEFSASLSEIDTATKALEVKLGKEPAPKDMIGLGFEAEDVLMFNRLCEVQKFQFSEKYPTFDSAWHDYERLNGKVDIDTAMEEPTQVDDRTARKDRMAQVLGHPKTLGNQRAKVADQGLTKEYASRWLATHPDPDLYTEQDAQTFSRIKKMQGIG